MSDEVARLLETWGVPDLIEKFQEHYVDIDILPELTNDLIKELIPEIGLRHKFLKQWTACFNVPPIIVDIPVDDADDSMQLQYSTTTEENSFAEKENDFISKKRKRSHDQCSPPKITSISSENSTSSNDTIDKPIEDFGSNEKRALLPSSLHSSDFVENEQCTGRLASSSSKFSVKELMEKNAAGKFLYNTWSTKKKLTKENRRQLVHIIVAELITDENCLRNEDFDKLSDDIVSLFPSERKRTYYISPLSKHVSRSKKSESARGKLVNRFRNQIKQFRRQKKGIEKITSSVKNEAVESSVVDSVEWLKYNNTPFEYVKKHWKKTTKYRYNELQKSNTSIYDHIEQWSALKDSNGHVLIEIDFKLIFNNSESILYRSWESFFEKIQALRSLKHSTATSLLQILESEDLSHNSKIVTQLLLLPFYVPPKSIIKNKKNHWKPSITECQESIIVHVKIPGDIEKAQEEKRNKMRKYGLAVQPYIIAVGPTIQEIKDYYVTIDRIQYRVDSPLKALDVCFKSFHVFFAQYPPESEHLYLLLQLAIYKFTTKWDKSISHILEILNDVKIP